MIDIQNLPESELLDVQNVFDAVMTPAQSLTELAVRFFTNLLVCFVITRVMYYPKSRRSDYYFTFMAFSSALLLLLHKMGSVEVGVGLTLGLFAIFGVIRYRTETVPIREMTYLFVIIAVSAINGLSTVYRLVDADGATLWMFSWQDVGICVLTNVAVLALLLVLEKSWTLPRTASKIVLYDKIDLIVPGKRSEMIEDLKKRTGLEIVDVETGQIDFLKDAAFVKVIYTPARGETNSIQSVRKLYEN